MSKFTRDQLKDLVKECLVEILSEGLSADLRMVESTASVPPPRRTPRPQPVPLPHRANSSALNSVVYGTGRPAQKVADRASPPSPPRSAIVESIGTLTSDPVMSQIFADTATTTLQEQFQAESGRPGTPSGDELVGSPVDIFSESAKNWAALAFSESSRRS